jgi:hypothetical protein
MLPQAFDRRGRPRETATTPSEAPLGSAADVPAGSTAATNAEEDRWWTMHTEPS